MEKQYLELAYGFSRQNPIKEFIYSFFQSICRGPMTMIEVFLRKKMGHHYFTFFWPVFNAFVLFWIPVVIVKIGNYYGSTSIGDVVLQHATWYIFLAVFLVFAWIRRKESKPNTGYFTRAYYSLSSGWIHPKFFDIKINGKEPTIRHIETRYEPAVAFLTGVIFLVFHQLLGVLLIFCAIIYSMSKRAFYRMGDKDIQARIDADLVRKSYYTMLLKLYDDSKETGCRFVRDVPETPEERQELYDIMMEKPAYGIS